MSGGPILNCGRKFKGTLGFYLQVIKVESQTKQDSTCDHEQDSARERSVGSGTEGKSAQDHKQCSACREYGNGKLPACRIYHVQHAPILAHSNGAIDSLHPNIN